MAGTRRGRAAYSGVGSRRRRCRLGGGFRRWLRYRVRLWDWLLWIAHFLILVRLKLTAVNVILVDLCVRVPLLRQIIQRENGRHRTDGNTGAAVNALSGIDVQLRHFI